MTGLDRSDKIVGGRVGVDPARRDLVGEFLKKVSGFVRNPPAEYG
jgi:hypothetical protein